MTTIKQNFNVLECTEIPRVVMDSMNDVHTDELMLVNQLNELIEKSRKSGRINLEISQAIERWIDHTNSHFDRENSMMVSCSFPAYQCHFSEHQDALQTLESVYREWKEIQNLDALADYVQNVWPKWFVHHISIMDVVTSAFIKQSMEAE